MKITFKKDELNKLDSKTVDYLRHKIVNYLDDLASSQAKWSLPAAQPSYTFTVDDIKKLSDEDLKNAWICFSQKVSGKKWVTPTDHRIIPFLGAVDIKPEDGMARAVKKVTFLRRVMGKIGL